MGVTGRSRHGGRATGDDAPPEVVVEVDRLIIVGIDSLDQDALSRAVEAELAGRLATLAHDAWGSGLAVDRLSASADLGTPTVRRSWSIGSQIGGSVHDAIASALPDGSTRSTRER